MVPKDLSQFSIHDKNMIKYDKPESSQSVMIAYRSIKKPPGLTEGFIMN